MLFPLAVVDTNVPVSGLLTIHTIPARVVDMIYTGRIHCLYDERILDEYRRVPSRQARSFAAARNDGLTPGMIREVYGVPVDILRHQGQTVVVPAWKKPGIDHLHTTTQKDGMGMNCALTQERVDRAVDFHGREVMSVPDCGSTRGS